MKLAILLALLLTSACQAPPAWLPGDPPLSFHTTDDRIWTAIRQACESWRDGVGLACRREEIRASAAVQVSVEVTDLGSEAWAYSRQDLGGWHVIEWEHEIVLRPGWEGWKVERLHGVVAHEIGHLLGFRDHLADYPDSLMAPWVGSVAPTQVDIDAVLQGWGMEAGDL